MKRQKKSSIKFLTILSSVFLSAAPSHANEGRLVAHCLVPDSTDEVNLYQDKAGQPFVEFTVHDVTVTDVPLKAENESNYECGLGAWYDPNMQWCVRDVPKKIPAGGLPGWMHLTLSPDKAEMKIKINHVGGFNGDYSATAVCGKAAENVIRTGKVVDPLAVMNLMGYSLDPARCSTVYNESTYADGGDEAGSVITSRTIESRGVWTLQFDSGGKHHFYVIESETITPVPEKIEPNPAACPDIPNEVLVSNGLLQNIFSNKDHVYKSVDGSCYRLGFSIQKKFLPMQRKYVVKQELIQAQCVAGN